MTPSKQTLERAVASMEKRVRRADAAYAAYVAIPSWHWWRRRKAWNEWGAAVADFQPFEVLIAEVEKEMGPGGIEPPTVAL